METVRVGLDRAGQRRVAAGLGLAFACFPCFLGVCVVQGWLSLHLPLGRLLPEVWGSQWVPGARFALFMALYALAVRLQWTDVTVAGLRPRGLGSGGAIAWSQVAAVEPVEKKRGRRTWTFIQIRTAAGQVRTLPGSGRPGATDPVFVERIGAVRREWDAYRTRSAST